MKPTYILLILAVVAAVVFLASRKKNGIQNDVDEAVAQENYQFIALLDKNGKWTYPRVPGIPDWYFQTTGIRIRQTKPETTEADTTYMKNYNDALYKTLKAQDKFHVIEESVAKIKANLDKQQQGK